MLLQEIENDPELKRLVFEYFYCFSRFEFSLKANDYFGKDRQVRDGVYKVKADWKKFREKYEEDYVLSKEAGEVLAEPPLLQVIYEKDRLGFIPESFAKEATELRVVIGSLHRIRNNLFHGGKHGANGEEDLKRNKFLLEKGKIILDQLAKLDPNIGFDYPGGY